MSTQPSTSAAASPVPVTAGIVNAFHRVEPGVLRTLLIFTFAMIVAPIGMYYFAAAIAEQAEASMPHIVGAIAAVVVVQIVMAAFVVVALREDKNTAATSSANPADKPKAQ
ncbi:VMA21 domain-containing protein [Capsaspora owczarzaki ATCC 30864]|uniref:VMA21 domain-containing protein n=1 Tax=Capsaspora owczarzaki (strain ATCC 30864) TaxID=595528 RepID=UPI0001FE5383|nr:VMA21 domain-containing protein [Capsaspora owczarzaki ATCC 30864]|eukprot:XP_004365925.1 VMA21 domain-containing protein [Capsaspora owczarzaki ATCC 30864]